MALGCFPRVTVIHTSKKVHGQIYIPEINWIVMCLSIAIVGGFRSTEQIGHAYGIYHHDARRQVVIHPITVICHISRTVILQVMKLDLRFIR